MYPITRAPIYDFDNQTYSDSYPNLHKYPATMLPQIGIQILREFNISNGRLLDPYCGSGSTFAAGLECGLRHMEGYDRNPLAVLISRSKFTKLNLDETQHQKDALISAIEQHICYRKPLTYKPIQFFNGDYWFSDEVLRQLSIISHLIHQIDSIDIKRFFSVAFSETLRESSYTRNGEFKLYRISQDDLETFQPEPHKLFTQKLERNFTLYKTYYYPKLTGVSVHIHETEPHYTDQHYDLVLTSPPYGDSQTTVAYGQFSRFANEWIGITDARNIDNLLMGGQKKKHLHQGGVIFESLLDISSKSPKRAIEVSSFYIDLAKSIQKIAKTIKRGGKAIYIVGNRRVKGVQLPTDQFIAEQFTHAGFQHIVTYERVISTSKVMPKTNSPSNVKGETAETMSQEFIVVCERVS